MPHAKMTVLALTCLAALAVSSAAQADPDAAFRAALSGARGEISQARSAGAMTGLSARSQAAAAESLRPSCSDAKELETGFSMSVTYPGGRKPLEVSFSYSGCREEGRNDYLPPYTERYYQGGDGYLLVIVTNEGETSSEVLLSRSHDWVGRFGTIPHADILSGGDMGAALKDGQARLRKSAALPDLSACEAALAKSLSFAAPVFRDGQGKPNLGFGSAAYNERGPMTVSLVLLTDSAAYYYYEDCDICANLDRCELKTAAVSGAVAAHSVRCEDLPPFRQGTVLYDACPPR